MFACVPRLVLLSHNPVLRTTKSAPMHLCSSVPSLRYHEPFIPPHTHGGASWSSQFLTLTWPSTVVVPLTSSRDDLVFCCRSAVPLRLSRPSFYATRVSSRYWRLASPRRFDIRRASRLCCSKFFTVLSLLFNFRGA